MRCESKLKNPLQEENSPVVFICTLDGNHDVHEDEVTGAKWDNEGNLVD